jgi:hypothetical protein
MDELKGVFLRELVDIKPEEITVNDMKMFLRSLSEESTETLAFFCLNYLVKVEKMTFREISNILSISLI